MNPRARIALVALAAVLLIALSTSLAPSTLSPFSSLPTDDIEDEVLKPATGNVSTPAQKCIPEAKTPEVVVSPPPWDPSSVLNGPPSDLGLSNLRDDKAYITTWTVDGFTNQFMGYINLVYLGTLSDRIPILPPFAPSFHLAPGAPTIPFGEVFNVSAFRDAIHYPIIEWKDVKKLTTSIRAPPKEQQEKIGCWSTSRPIHANHIDGTSITNNLGLDAAYTRIPAATRINETNPEEIFYILTELAQFIYPPRPQPHHEALMSPTSNGETLAPNTRLACFDNLYYASTTRTRYEWHTEWTPFWNQIAKHVRFSDNLVSITREYIANAFSADIEQLPPFVAVHMRRADFGNGCKDKLNCFIPFSAFEEKVAEVKQKAESQFGFPVERVLLFSDDESDEFWSQARALGWHGFDHARVETVEKYGHWYPTLIDVAAQSMAHAFVGTDGSTFSLLSVRRVSDWQGGPTAMVHK